MTVLFANTATAQVPVKNEPRHHPVFENKYIRLLDVHLPPGDTTRYHIHATPSVFVILSNTVTASQIKGEEWSTAAPALGNVWYRSFYPDTLVHRVCNTDSVEFHVNDIEILSFYDSAHVVTYKPLSFPVLFNNERVAAYRITKPSELNSTISSRGPIIIELVTGKGLMYQDVATNQKMPLTAGKYTYVKPGTSFRLTGNQTSDINLVIFEFK
ncbi:MAG: hypothetical protein QM802_00815 [Agriterribacter sp.]